MARTPKNHEAAAELGERLTALWTASGKPKPKQIELWVAAAFSIHYSDESIRKAHAGDVDPLGCDPGLLAALAAFYEVEPAALGPATERRFRNLLTMASASSDPKFRPPDRDFATSRCIQPSLFTLFAEAA